MILDDTSSHATLSSLASLTYNNKRNYKRNIEKGMNDKQIKKMKNQKYQVGYL